MVNHSLAGISNAALVTAIMVYGLAMLAYAFDFAFTRRQVAASVAAPATDKEKVTAAALVSVGAGPDLPDGNFGADPSDPSQLADLSDQATGSGGGSEEGTGSENIDLFGHLAGFVVGILLGATAAMPWCRRPSGYCRRPRCSGACRRPVPGSACASAMRRRSRR